MTITPITLCVVLLVLVTVLSGCSPSKSEIRDRAHTLLAQLEKANSADEEMQCIEQLRALPGARAHYEILFADNEGKPVSELEFYKLHNANPQLFEKIIFRYTTVTGRGHTFVRTFCNEEAFKFYFMPQ